MGRVKRIWYLSPMRAAKVQVSLRIRAVSPEPSLLAHTSSESRGTFRQKARSLAPLNGWACAVKICHDGMLEDTNSLDAVQMSLIRLYKLGQVMRKYVLCHMHICSLISTFVVRCLDGMIRVIALSKSFKILASFYSRLVWILPGQKSPKTHFHMMWLN